MRKSASATQNHNKWQEETSKKGAGSGVKGGFGVKGDSLNEKLWRIQDVRSSRKRKGIQGKFLVSARCPSGEMRKVEDPFKSLLAL